MLKKLQTKWKVGIGRLTLILVCFAAGGSLCGWLARKIVEEISPENNLFWIIFYLVIVTILWPVCVMLVSIPLGQFSFFRNYLNRLSLRLSGRKQKSVARLAVFASGAGSNAEKLLEHFNCNNSSGTTHISLIVCNKAKAGVIQIAEKYEVPVLQLKKANFETGDHYLPALAAAGITHIILAGFLWKIPAPIVAQYAGKILNIHPALLPKYGGAGMYGSRVHEAVVAAGETHSGITIHEVDELYDNGKIIYQQKCALEPGETADSLAQKIHTLEHRHFAEVVDRWLAKN